MCILKNYTKLVVSIICIILIVLVLGSASIVYSYMQENIIIQEEISGKIYTNITDEVKETKKGEEIEYILNDEFNGNWYIEIPKIGLLAPISEGTSQEVMSKYVGHFEITAVWEGNIGLAAHNRRMPSKLF